MYIIIGFKSIYSGLRGRSEKASHAGPKCCRKQDCPPGHEAGPTIRDHFLIHFIRRGSGVFHTRGHSYTLSKSQCFVIFPGIPAWYRARRHNPWSYSWIGFSGPGFTENFREWGLEPDSPVLTLDDTCRAYYYLDEIVARSVGYRNPLHFSRSFRGRIGCSPTEFRKKGRKFEEKEGLS